jgi:hypothetical protein
MGPGGGGGTTGGGPSQGGRGPAPGRGGATGATFDAFPEAFSGAGGGVPPGRGGAGGAVGGAGAAGGGAGPGGAGAIGAGGAIAIDALNRDVPPTVGTALVVRPTGAFIPIKSTIVCNAYVQVGATFRDVTALSTWSVSDSALAMIVSAGPMAGRLTGLAAGPITVRATFQQPGMPALSAIASETITAAQINQIILSPATAMTTVGGRAAMQAIALYSDGSSRSITEQGIWTSDNPAVATVSNDPQQRGSVQGVSPGNTNVGVAFAGFERRGTVTVGGAPTSLTIAPATATAGIGQFARYQATAVSGGITSLVTNQAMWASANPAIATMAAPGAFRCAASGMTTVTAMYMGTAAKAELTCGDGMARPIKELRLTPEEATIPANVSIRLTITAIYADGTSMVLMGAGAWMSSNPMVADVTQAGQVRTLRAGMATITVTLNGLTAKANVTVTGN